MKPRRLSPTRKYLPDSSRGGYGLTEMGTDDWGAGGFYYTENARPLPPRRRHRLRLPGALRGVSRVIPWVNGIILLEDLNGWMWPDAPVGLPHRFSVPGGWVRCSNPTTACTAAWEPETHWRWSAVAAGGCAPFGSCPTNQAIGDAQLPGTTVPGGTRELWRLRITNVALQRFTVFERFKRTGGGSSQPDYYRGYVVLPSAEPWEEPSPWAQPQKMNYPASAARTSVGVSTRVSASGPGGSQGPAPERPGGGSVPPWWPPSVDIPVDGSPPRPGHHAPVPPGRNDREGKVTKVPPWARAAGQAYGGLTEVNDMLDCVAESMGMPTPTGGVHERARKILDALNDPARPRADGDAFAACMALANLKDLAIGKVSKATARRLNKSPYVAKRPYGYRGGGWSTRMR